MSTEQVSRKSMKTENTIGRGRDVVWRSVRRDTYSSPQKTRSQPLRIVFSVFIDFRETWAVDIFSDLMNIIRDLKTISDVPQELGGKEGR